LSQPRKFDLSYITVDSVSEGVGSSQILRLLQRLSAAGLSINLISFEKVEPSSTTRELLKSLGVQWDLRQFKANGALGGFTRLLEISKHIPETNIIHARSDIAAVAASLSRRAPILWDVRSLWADQKAYIEPNPIRKRVLKSYRLLENISSFNASAMSTLTHSVVPELERRHHRLPKLRIVVPTAVDLDRFKFNSVIKRPFRGLYSGTYNNYYDLDLSKRFIDELSRRAEIEVHWARPHESRRKSLDAGESHVFESTQNEMANRISEYSFGLSICKLDAGPSLKAAMPTKVAEFLACGKPVVVNAGLGDFDEYLSEFNAGVILDGSAKELSAKAEELLNLMTDPETPMRCRQLAEKYFDIDKGAEKYLHLYKKMQS
jgi:glycosyltransferase involved in cell wall biosynthesis